jgi:hypothetical protein
MLKKLILSCIIVALVSLLACVKNQSNVAPDSNFSTRQILWDSACSGTTTIKGRVELKNTNCGSKYAIYAVKHTKVGIYDSISRRLIETRFEVLDEAKDRKKIIEQDAASDFSTTLAAGYYLIYAYPTACEKDPSRHWSFGDTLRFCGNQVKDFGTVKF